MPESLDLFVRPRFGPPRRVGLGARSLTIGRGSHADLRLNDVTVSTVHARIEPWADGYCIVDCQSRNGTFVNKVRVERSEIRPGDQIAIGTATLTVIRAGDPDPRQEAPHEPAATVAIFREDDTATLTVGPEDLEVEFLEPRTVAAANQEEAEVERLLTGLYRAARTLVPLDEDSPLEVRLARLAMDLVGSARACVIRCFGPRGEDSEVLAEERAANAPGVSEAAPGPDLLREAVKIRRPILYRAQGEAAGRPATAIVVPFATEDPRGILLLYVDSFDPATPLLPEDMRLLGIIGRIGAVWASNARLRRALADEKAALDRRVAERTAELDEANRRLASLADIVVQAALPIFTVEADGRISSWNAAAEHTFGYPAAEAIGRSVMELVEPNAREAFEALLRARAAAPERAPAEFGMRRKDGGHLETQVTISRLVGAAGAPPTLSLVVHDVTGQKRLQAELIQSSKLAAIGTLASGIAHEFNNVLAIVLGNVELAAEATTRAEVDEHIRAALEAGRRSKDVVRHLLTFARRREGKRERIELVELLEASLRIMEADFLRCGIRIRRHFAAIPPVEVDAAQLTLVFLNVLKNAREAMAEKGGDLTVALRRSARLAIVEIRDTGPGMTREVRQHLFEPFFTTKPFGEGTGLGLSTSYGIVRGHDGTIEVESEPGRGTLVRIALPLLSGDVEETRMAGLGERAVPAFASEAKLEVLIVDDDESVRQVLTAIVRRLGYNATAAGSGEEALRAVEGRRFDMVVADYAMPRMTGVELKKALEERKVKSEFLMVTGDAYCDELVRQHGLSIESMIRKPFTIEEVRKVLAAAAERARRA